MPLKARVGRHTQANGRQCQNYLQDQQTVIDLLNRISAAKGGAGGSLKGHIVSDVCSDVLYHAISQFEDKYFPRQRHGFVDPGGPLLKRMEESAGGTVAKPVAETSLDILRRNVLGTDAKLKGFWTVGDRVQMDALIAMAVKHVDELKRMNLNKLPWWAELFGRAYVTTAGAELVTVHGWRGLKGMLKKPHLAAGHTHRVSDEMKYGARLTWTDYIVTWKLPALILFEDGLCAPFPSDVQFPVAAVHESLKHGQVLHRP
jgi:hypothetical protein